MHVQEYIGAGVYGQGQAQKLDDLGVGVRVGRSTILGVFRSIWELKFGLGKVQEFRSWRLDLGRFKSWICYRRSSDY